MNTKSCFYYIEKYVKHPNFSESYKNEIETDEDRSYSFFFFIYKAKKSRKIKYCMISYIVLIKIKQI